MIVEAQQKTDSAINDDLVLFLKEFKDERGEYKYRKTIETMPGSGNLSLVVDYIDLVMWNNDFAIKTVQFPHLFLPILDKALKEVIALSDQGFMERNSNTVHVRIRGLLDETALRNIPGIVNNLASVQGLVTRVSVPMPMVVNAVWRCIDGHKIEMNRPGKPTICVEGCESTNFLFIKEESTFGKFQIIRMQESNEDLPSAKIPDAFDMRLEGDLVGAIKPGDTVRATGVVSVEFATGRQDTRLLQYQINANYIETMGKSPEDVMISEEERNTIRSFALHPLAYERLIESVAPAIEGEELAKEGALLLSIGSYPVNFKDGTSVRGTINFLICGDPGLAKTQLLGFMAKLAPRGIYSNGKASSAAGLTAAVVKEKNGMLYLEPGVVVLADQGIACIDEFLQMSKEDAAALHEAMEQGTVSVSKAGFVSRLNARTSILAAANPLLGKYDPYKSILENLEGFAIPLLTRFDMILIARDEMNTEKDARVAQRVLSQIRKGDYEKVPPLSSEMLKKYIIYAKSIKPELTDEVSALIAAKYQEMRKQFSGENVPITPRWLESLIRISIARARSLLHARVTTDDVLRAIMLLEKTLKSAAIDPKTNKVDFGILQGKPLGERQKMEVALTAFKELSGSERKEILDRDFKDALMKSGSFNEEEAEKMLRVLYRSGQIYETKPHFYRRIM